MIDFKNMHSLDNISVSSHYFMKERRGEGTINDMCF